MCHIVCLILILLMLIFAGTVNSECLNMQNILCSFTIFRRNTKDLITLFLLVRGYTFHSNRCSNTEGTWGILVFNVAKKASDSNLD